MPATDEALFLTAAATIEPATDAAKPPALSIIAYSGGIMTVPGFGAVVIELSGLQAGAEIPLLADHDSSLAGIVGRGTAKVARGTLAVNGQLAPSSENAQRILALHRDGFQFQASVGVMPAERQFVRPGETVTANGRQHIAAAGGMLFVRSGTLKEVSITALGADQKTRVDIKAKGKTTMPDSTLTPEEIILAERQRVTDIEAACQPWLNVPGVADLRAAAVAGDIELPDLRAKLLESAARGSRLQQLRENRPTPPAGIRINGGATISGPDTLAAALLLRANLRSAAESFGERICAEADVIRGRGSLVDLCAMALQLDGKDVPRDRHELIRAAFSTMSMQNALGNATGRSLEMAYKEAPASWRTIANIKPAANFKTQTSIRPTTLGQIEKVGNGGEVKHGAMDEDTFDWSIETYAKVLRVTRTNVINDDLGFLDDTAPAMARMALRGLSDLVYTVLMANAGNFFSTANGNYIEGAATNLQFTSLEEAIVTMRKLRDAAGNDLDIMPRTLLVPSDLGPNASQLLDSEYMARPTSGQLPTGNPLRGLVDWVEEPRLANDAKFANASAKGWYLFSAPSDSGLVVGFLDGRTLPTVEFFGLDSEVETLGVSWRVVFDYGAALGDTHGAFKSKGEA